MGTQSTVLVPHAGKAEIALVLDYSGSMWGAVNGAIKFFTMRDAAKDLIAQITAAAEDPENIKFSLVPFSYGKVDHVDPYERVIETLVLLTDGRQSSPAYRRGGERQNNLKTSDLQWPLNDTNGEKNLENLCKNTKAAGWDSYETLGDLNPGATDFR